MKAATITIREHLPMFCPVCGVSVIHQLPLQLLRAVGERESDCVGGVQAFECEDLGHIFFIQTKDLPDTMDS